jgi:hypothetical protein
LCLLEGPNPVKTHLMGQNGLALSLRIMLFDVLP